MIEIGVVPFVVALLIVGGLGAVLGAVAAMHTPVRHTARVDTQRRADLLRRDRARFGGWGPPATAPLSQPPTQMLTMPTRPWPSVRSGEVVDTKEMRDVP